MKAQHLRKMGTFIDYFVKQEDRIGRLELLIYVK